MAIIKRVRVVCLLTVLTMLLITIGCGSSKPAFVNVGENGSRTDDEVGFQFDPPADGEEIAILHTDLGDIKIRLFPKSAPIGVENFRQLIKKGYYDGLTFHRAEADFVIQGGDPNGDGTGGEDAWGGTFEYEYNSNLRHFYGALSYAHSQLNNSNSSQFFIVQNSDCSKADIDLDEQLEQGAFDEATYQLYKEHGGTPFLDDGYTVFGQVFEGMDVVDEIASMEVETDGNIMKLKEPVVITSAELTKYQG